MASGVGTQYGTITHAASFNPSEDHVGGRGLPCFPQEVMPRWPVTPLTFL